MSIHNNVWGPGAGLMAPSRVRCQSPGLNSEGFFFYFFIYEIDNHASMKK